MILNLKDRQTEWLADAVELLSRVHDHPVTLGFSDRDHDNRLLSARATARSVPTVGFDTLPVSNFDSVARSMPDRSERSERLKL
jgi:hypothetical protein